MTSFIMHNDAVTVTIDEHASEIHSFKDNATGIEYMWQGDPAFWSGRNPTLFPLVGSTWDKKLHLKGNEYPIGNHGFCRHSDFTCIEHDENHVVMELKDSEETLKQFPYHFDMKITYTLEDTTLKISYAIENTSDETMPFSFGLHPAFNCPVEPGKNFEDYSLRLNVPEKVDEEEKDVIELDRDKLQATIIITNPESTESVLTDGEHGVRVGYTGYKWLAFWSPKAPFVCIEPWFGHTDFGKTEVPFEEREGTLFLNAGDTFKTDYTITVF